MNELNRIIDLSNQLEKLKPLASDKKNILDKKFRLEFNYNTNHIEGSTITYSETELLLIFDDAKGDHTFRELEEMKGSDVAFHFIQDLAQDKERPLTEQSIKSLNEILLVRPFWKDAVTEDGQSTRRQIKVGQYKEYPNSVRLQNGEIFHYADPIETPRLMAELIEWYRNEEEKKELHPVTLAALLHYKFVRIHPFDDGNGRVSRLLMNYVLFKHDLPPIVIKSSDKRNYLTALNRADAGDLDSFTVFIAQQLIWSLEISIKAAKGENLDEPGDLDKKIKLLKQKLNASDEVITITRTREVILKTFSENIEPLLIELAAKLSEFDSLFRSKQVWISSGDIAFGTTLESSITEFPNQTNRRTITKIKFNYIFKNFRKGEEQYSFSCSVFFEFHPNAYDMYSEDIDYKFSKLYHEKITDSEKQEIIEQIGTTIYDKIEGVI